MEYGSRRMLNQAKPIMGFSDTETVKLDLDNLPLEAVKHWALKTLKQFRLRGFIILKSSERSYHVVFDRAVSWRKNVGIVAWVCLMTKHRRLTEWLVMQCIKQSSTLRVSPKGQKPSPRVVYRYGKQNGQTRVYLGSRTKIKRIQKSVGNQNLKFFKT
jgi:hypothetical protein